MAGHEIGHILFTDFQMRDLYASSLAAGRMYPAEPSGLTTKEQIYLSELKQVYDDEEDGVAVPALVKAALYVHNILEDMYIEARMTDAFPGVYRTGILLNLSLIHIWVDKAAFRWSKIQAYLKTHEYIRNADVRELCGVSAATANRILAGLAADNTLEKYRIGGHWGI